MMPVWRAASKQRGGLDAVRAVSLIFVGTLALAISLAPVFDANGAFAK
jgi:hypothetical protein